MWTHIYISLSVNDSGSYMVVSHDVRAWKDRIGNMLFYDIPLVNTRHTTRPPFASLSFFYFLTSDSLLSTYDAGVHMWGNFSKMKNEKQ